MDGAFFSPHLRRQPANRREVVEQTHHAEPGQARHEPNAAAEDGVEAWIG